MEKYQIGDRVALEQSALSLSYIAGRHFYTNMYAGKTGKVIGYTADGSKLAIEFDTIVFVGDRKSSHDNGCHGRGKLHYSWYIPHEFVTKIEEENELLLLL